MHLDFHQHFRSGRVNLQSLISRVFALRQAAEALALACAKTGVVKVQLDLN
jgi:threonine dehydrogenase-like Zn-dependent dehydrogenase